LGLKGRITRISELWEVELKEFCSTLSLKSPKSIIYICKLVSVKEACCLLHVFPGTEICLLLDSNPRQLHSQGSLSSNSSQLWRSPLFSTVKSGNIVSKVKSLHTLDSGFSRWSSPHTELILNCWCITLTMPWSMGYLKTTFSRRHKSHYDIY
jgi:hypothetical protein